MGKDYLPEMLHLALEALTGADVDIIDIEGDLFACFGPEALSHLSTRSVFRYMLFETKHLPNSPWS
jgi:hypothetical protein